MKKTVETELKFKLEESRVSALKDKLEELFFEQTKKFYQKTSMYDDKVRSFHEVNARLRFREEKSVGYTRYELSYKRPLPSKTVKKEIEITTQTDGLMVDVLELMGYELISSYEKERTVFENDNVEVVIDRYPFATFLEIEGNEKEIQRIARQLGFNLKDSLIKPCDTLFQEWRAERGLPFKPFMAFKDYDR